MALHLLVEPKRHLLLLAACDRIFSTSPSIPASPDLCGYLARYSAVRLRTRWISSSEFVVGDTLRITKFPSMADSNTKAASAKSCDLNLTKAAVSNWIAFAGLRAYASLVGRAFSEL